MNRPVGSSTSPSEGTLILAYVDIVRGMCIDLEMRVNERAALSIAIEGI